MQQLLWSNRALNFYFPYLYERSVQMDWARNPLPSSESDMKNLPIPIQETRLGVCSDRRLKTFESSVLTLFWSCAKKNSDLGRKAFKQTSAIWL